MVILKAQSVCNIDSNIICDTTNVEWFHHDKCQQSNNIKKKHKHQKKCTL